MIHAHKKYNRIQDPAKKIADNEPVFLIRAKDKVSVAAVRAWIELSRIAGCDPELLHVVLKHVELMEEWQTKNGCKVAE